MKLKLCVIVILSILITNSTMVYANQTPIQMDLALSDSLIKPLMEHIAYANISLYVDSNGIATISGNILGYQGITSRIWVDAKLQRYANGTWINIESFEIESISYRSNFSKSTTVSKGTIYRVQSTILAYSGSSVDYRNVISNEVSF